MKSCSFNEKFIGKLSLDTVGVILWAGNRKHFWKRRAWKHGRISVTRHKPLFQSKNKKGKALLPCFAIANLSYSTH